MRKVLYLLMALPLLLLVPEAAQAQMRGQRSVHGLHRHKHQLNNRPPAKHTHDLRTQRRNSTR